MIRCLLNFAISLPINCFLSRNSAKFFSCVWVMDCHCNFIVRYSSLKTQTKNDAKMLISFFARFVKTWANKSWNFVRKKFSGLNPFITHTKTSEKQRNNSRVIHILTNGNVTIVITVSKKMLVQEENFRIIRYKDNQGTENFDITSPFAWTSTLIPFRAFLTLVYFKGPSFVISQELKLDRSSSTILEITGY